MGIGIGFPCCDCVAPKIWRIAMSANHGFYGTRTPKEFTITGTSGGFEWTTVPDGTLSGEIVESFIKMTNLGGNDWRFEIEQNGLGEQTIDFTHDFTTGLKDVEIEFTINDNVKQVVTIMDYADPRPSDFLWFPNRSPQDSIRIVYNKFPVSPIRLEGQRTVHTALMTHSEDSTYHYWTATLGGDTHRMRADKGTGVVSHSFALGTGTPSSDYYQLQYIAWPFHASLFYRLAEGSSGPFWDGFIFDENDPPLVEKFVMTELLDNDLEVTTYRSDLMIKDWVTQNTWRRARLQLNQAFLTANSSPWLFNASGINALVSPLSVSRQQAVIATAHDEVTVWLTVLVGPFSSITYQAYPKTFAVDVDGRFSGTVRFRVLGNDVDISVSGRVVASHVPADYWPDMDEEFSGQFEQTKIWLPEYYSKGREHDDPAFNWILAKNVPAKLLGKPAFTTHPAPTPTSQGPVYTQPEITIESGSLPTGMSVSSNLGVTHTELVVQGTPTADENGTVQFRIRSSITKYGGTSFSDFVTEQLDYVSKVYSWIVGTGSPFTITYPTNFTNDGNPPSAGKEWRIDGATMVGTPLSIPATITGASGSQTCTVISGTLPPSALINGTSGEIYTVGFSPLSPSATGSVVIKCVDSASNEAISATYDWEYIGT